jgi:light-regulated signal transduction histidine kinase (bacteriophytochrome)
VPPQVRVAADPVVAEGRCVLLVEDNGIGFEMQYLARIFLPFQRLHGLSQYEGTGMGLAVCSKIVQRHRGTITARSAPGQGSTFIVDLPLQQNTSGSPTP